MLHFLLVAPAILAAEAEIAIAVASVVCFGTFGMLFYPHLVHILFESPKAMGVMLGLCIHDTSQVIGAAIAYGQYYDDGDDVVKSATITKLTRNLALAIVIPGLVTFVEQSTPNAIIASSKKTSSMLIIQRLISSLPPFIIFFIGMVTLRSVGDITLQTSKLKERLENDISSEASTSHQLLSSKELAFGILSASQWSTLLRNMETCSTWSLVTAMSAVGTSISVAALRGIGFKPMLLGLSGSLLIGMTGVIAGFTVQSLTVISPPKP